MILNHICEAWGVSPPYRILENMSELNRQNSNQLPIQLQNQLNDIDFKMQLNFTKSISENPSKRQKLS